jgi:alpha-beta hydrolase superfamily lysophospholipase
MIRRRLRIALAAVALPVTAVAAAIGGAIMFGGPVAPPPMASIADPFAKVEWRTQPSPYRWPPGGDEGIAVRAYPAGTATASAAPGLASTPISGGDRAALLIHGSAGAGSSMHALAHALSAGGIHAYTMDVRGHGGTGPRGDVDRPGRITDDVVALAEHIRGRHPGARLALVGFSLGGGYTLGFAAGPRGDRFDGYVLLAPFLGREAPASRPAGGRWVGIGMPRIIALATLEGLGMRWFQDWPVLAFAVKPDSTHVTSSYSFRLFREFAPPADYLAAARGVTRPIALVVGAEDELIDGARFGETLAPARPDIRAEIVPGIDHIGLIVSPEGTAAARAAVLRVLSSAP